MLTTHHVSCNARTIAIILQCSQFSFLRRLISKSVIYCPAMVIIPRWAIALVVYLLIVSLLILFKPALMFHADGSIKPSGTGLLYGSSPFSPAIAFPLIAMLCYLFSCVFSLALV